MKLHNWQILLLAVLVAALSLIGYVQHEQIVKLQKLTAVVPKIDQVQVPNSQEVPRATSKPEERETFTLNDAFYVVARRLEFTFEGKTGTITHACESPLKYYLKQETSERNLICAEKNILFMDFDGKRTIISEFTPHAFEDTKVLNDISVITPKGPLLISFDENPCSWWEGMCIDDAQIAYRISLPDGRVQPISTDFLLMGGFNQIRWNSSGTKGVLAVGCAEGCPKEKYYGVDLATGKTTLLIENDDFGPDGFIMPTVDDILWNDEKNVTIRGKTYSF
jgi:hypothetical protein